MNNNCIMPPVFGPGDGPFGPQRPTLSDDLSKIFTAKKYTEKDMSDKELDQELRKLQDEKDLRNTLRYFTSVLERVLGESEELNGLEHILKTVLNERQAQLLKDFVQTGTFETQNQSGSET